MKSRSVNTKRLKYHLFKPNFRWDLTIFWTPLRWKSSRQPYFSSSYCCCDIMGDVRVFCCCENGIRTSFLFKHGIRCHVDWHGLGMHTDNCPKVPLLSSHHKHQHRSLHLEFNEIKVFNFGFSRFEAWKREFTKSILLFLFF